ncbi:MAG TPA: single-stranded-DNA-specific exonuclease RecJ [Solirubrobacteraceae bacterium]|nr:single-stranded-DNA-specific exonuclease RecJ [Solirubrobacteraceae bacterium]
MIVGTPTLFATPPEEERESGARAPAEGRPAPPPRPVARIEVAPAPVADVLRLEREVGVSHVVAQALVRRGFGDPQAARAWLAADERHPASAFAGIEEAVAVVRRQVAAGTRITVHGDYDVDGVCSTSILVRALRRAGADVDWFLPSRTEDGYGLNLRTVERLARRGTKLLLTADCAITAVEEVAAARAAGMDVVVTDHHSPRADGALPDAPIVHPALGGYPCPDLCAAGVAYKLAGELIGQAADEDLDLVALATVADVVRLQGENRRLVRDGLRALAATGKPGLRALMRVAKVDPGRVDAAACGFRLAPRINAAGRLYRADAGLELLLTQDPDRALAVAEELDRVNAERRHTEQRILFAAEAQVAELGARPAYVLAADDWHPGVVGIVASRIAERYHRPAVLIALDGDTGTGSGRSVPGFDLLAALNACADHLLRHGGHRAAAGLEVRREDVEAFRAAFEAHAEEALTEDLRHPVERVDAVVAGDELGLNLAEELERLAPFGMGNPPVKLLVPAATLGDPRPMGENRHVRFTVETGGVRARAVAFGTAGKIPCDAEGPVDATFCLELNEWDGTVEPRLVLRHARPAQPGPVDVVAADDPAPAERPPTWPLDRPRDRRGGGIAGVLTSLVGSGESVLVVAADAHRRARHLRGRLGGFTLTDHATLERDPALAQRYDHLVVLDPPPYDGLAAAPGPMVHLVYGEQERAYALACHEHEYDLRARIAAIYRALRDGTGLAGWDPRVAARAIAVLAELGLVDPDGPSVRPAPQRTRLESSAAYRAYTLRLEEGRRFLSSRSTTETEAPQPAPAAA